MDAGHVLRLRDLVGEPWKWAVSRGNRCPSILLAAPDQNECADGKLGWLGETRVVVTVGSTIWGQRYQYVYLASQPGDHGVVGGDVHQGVDQGRARRVEVQAVLEDLLAGQVIPVLERGPPAVVLPEAGRQVGQVGAHVALELGDLAGELLGVERGGRAPVETGSTTKSARLPGARLGQLGPRLVPFQSP